MVLSSSTGVYARGGECAGGGLLYVGRCIFADGAFPVRSECDGIRVKAGAGEGNVVW